MFTNENKNKKCKRCGLEGHILSNGYCGRCDYVIYGYHSKNNK